jgi:hypothetical protein
MGVGLGLFCGLFCCFDGVFEVGLGSTPLKTAGVRARFDKLFYQNLVFKNS